MLLISSIQVLFLGCIYTLSRKYQNLQISLGIDGIVTNFHHPMYIMLIQISSLLAICWNGYDVTIPLFYQKRKD
jgi:hypothetical protein